MKVKVNITLDEEIKKRLQEEAKKKGLSISALVTVWVNELNEGK